MPASEMPPTRSELVAPKPQRRWRKPALIALSMVLLVVGTVGTIYFYLTATAEKRLREAIAEADRLDPGWRLEELEARRAIIPDAENSARCIARIKKLIPKNWGTDTWFCGNLDDIRAESQLNRQQIDLLRVELAKAPAALAEARKLKDLPRGRFVVNYTRDGISTLRPYLQDVRDVAYLLDKHAALQNQEGTADAALESGRCILNCGRSIGDDPCLHATLIRCSVRAIACGSIERTLAQGQPSGPSLEALRQLLEKEEAERLLLIGIRGERAGIDRLLQAMVAGELDAKKMREIEQWAAPGNGQIKDRPAFESALLKTSLGLRHQRAILLHRMNQCVEIARKPHREQVKLFRKLDADTSKEPPVAQLLVPALASLAEAEQRSCALLRCTIAAIAAERHRRARGIWPNVPTDLVTGGYLRAWPEDPYDGAPLRWKRLKDGVVIYTLGRDSVDNGGKLRFAPEEAGSGDPGPDIGFRLWDMASRRQPALPVRAESIAEPEEELGPDEP